MATEYFSVRHDSSKTVYFRFYDASQDKLFDFDDDTWQASPVNAKLAATEKTAMGDADESLYIASVDLADLYNSATPRELVVQAMDDLATDEIIQEAEFWVASGERVSIETMRGTDSSALASAYTAARAAKIDNLDATVSSRSDFDETADPVELRASGGAAGKNAAELVDDVFAETGITAGGTATFASILKAIYAMARGKKTISVSGSTVTLKLYDDDDSTLLWTLTITSAGATVA